MYAIPNYHTMHLLTKYFEGAIHQWYEMEQKRELILQRVEHEVTMPTLSALLVTTSIVTHQSLLRR